MRRSALCFTLAISMLAPVPAFAMPAAPDGDAPPATEPAPPAEPPPPATASAGEEQKLAEARGLYKEGEAKFNTFDYEGAIEKWTEAYATLPPTGEARAIRNRLVYNIATAQEKAFELDKDVSHLRQARGLLQQYVDEYRSLYKATPEGRKEVEDVQAQIARLDAKIAEAEGATPPATPPPPATNTAYTDAANRKAEVRKLLRGDPEIAPEYKSGRGMVIGGAVSLGIGGLFLLGAGAIASGGPNRTERNVAIGVGVVGLGLAVTGAVLLGLGIPKRKRAIRKANERVSVLPTLQLAGPGGAPMAGAGLRARF